MDISDIQLFTNTNYRKDILRLELETHDRSSKIDITSAFFSEANIIKRFLDNACEVRLIIRLSSATSPSKLDEIIDFKNINIRYFTGSKFHPKFYIFEHIAFLGSSNLTDSGLVSNNEVNISLPETHSCYKELKEIFQLYWKEANVLDREVLGKYSAIHNSEENNLFKIQASFNQKIESEIGKCEFSDTNFSKKEKGEMSETIEDTKKEYQTYLNLYKDLKTVYLNNGRRKISEDKLPLHIEIDQLHNFVREYKAQGESYKEQPIRTGKNLKDNIISLVNEYIDTDMPYFNKVVDENYPLIKKIFSSKEKVLSLTQDELKEGLNCVHSIRDRSRFFRGGYDALFEEILSNGLQRIKKTLAYLFFDTKEHFITRVAKCLHDDELRLKQVSNSAIKELYGWVNSDEIPTYNERTQVSMRYMGFDISSEIK